MKILGHEGVLGESHEGVIDPCFFAPVASVDLASVDLAPYVNWSFLDGLPADMTFTRASSAWYFNAAGTLTEAATDAPRFDYDPVTHAAKGLLLEEQRTNSIRNSTMIGAAEPSTFPTFWSGTLTSDAGLTMTTSSAGEENGIPYIDVTISGTATKTAAAVITLEVSGIAALTAQVWTISAPLKVVAGSVANFSNIVWTLKERTADSGSVKVNASASFAASIPTTPLGTYRAAHTATLSGGETTASIQPYLKIDCSTGAVVNLTIRIGLPQVELGAFATSFIPTSDAAVTRAKDRLYTATIPWFSATEGTFVLEYTFEGIRAGFDMYAGAFNDGSSNNQIAFSIYPAAIKADIAVSGTHKASGTSSALVAGNTYKSGIVYKSGANLIAHNGSALDGSTFAGSAIPTISRLTFMNYGDFGRPLSGWLRSFKYLPLAKDATYLAGATQ